VFIDISHLIPQLSRPISWDLLLTFHSFVSNLCLTSELKLRHGYGDFRFTYTFADPASSAGRSSPAPDCCSREAFGRRPPPPHSARDLTRPQEVPRLQPDLQLACLLPRAHPGPTSSGQGCARHGRCNAIFPSRVVNFSRNRPFEISTPTFYKWSNNSIHPRKHIGKLPPCTDLSPPPRMGI
jgi:hypothetical protein